MVEMADAATLGGALGVLLDKAIDAAGHPALFLVDCIASLGTETFEFDAWGVDVMVVCQALRALAAVVVG